MAFGVLTGPAAAQPLLRCTLSVPDALVAGQPVPLTMTLHNPGTQTAFLLRWGTPFEGRWLGASFRLDRDGALLPYQGPQAKRGDPDAAQYLALPAGAQASATLDLALVFDLNMPGHYRLRGPWQVHDAFTAAQGQPPRARAQLAPLDLPCPTLRWRLSAPAQP
ncbi:hypothetical protein [Ideonella dechloratans]|uniref:hypothetical protein n=1 Tax=Ideonella dechloratans TaxID=36863 RepID=UPI0035AF69B4